MHDGEKQGYLQMGKRRQVIEGAFRNTGYVVAMEGSEAEAQIRSTFSESFELSTLSRCPRPASQASEDTALLRPQQGMSPLSHGHGCFHTQLRSRNAVGRRFGKDQDELDVGWNQKSVPFSCGTLGELLSFSGPPFLPLKNGERWLSKGDTGVSEIMGRTVVETGCSGADPATYQLYDCGLSSSASLGLRFPL